MKYRYICVFAALAFGLVSIAAQDRPEQPGTVPVESAPESTPTKQPDTIPVEEAPEQSPLKQPDAIPVEKSPDPTPVRRPDAIPVERSPDAVPDKHPERVPIEDVPVSIPVIQPIGPGEVDWTHRAVRATGMSVINKEMPGPQARAMAIRGARVDAQRNLLETVKGVRVVAETRAEDLMTRSDYVYTRVDGIIRGAVQTGEPREEDGLMVVTMEIPLYGQNGIAPPLAEEFRKALSPTRKIELSPDEKQALESISGIIFDLTETDIQPELFPTLVDPAGNVLLELLRYYDAGQDALDKLRYVRTIEDLLNDPELRQNPVIIRVVDFMRQGWVVAEQDVPKVSWLQRGLEVLLRVGKAVMMFL